MTRNLLAVLVAVLALGAQDWPQWRGPNRDGEVASFTAPKSWPERLTQRWKVAVGAGYSSPVVVGDRVYVLARQDEDEVVSCLELQTGKLVWQDKYPASYRMNPVATRHGKGPKSTPVAAGGKLFTLGISGILSSYDLASGKLRWRKQFSEEFKETSPLYGTAMSPVLDGGALIVHIGGHDQGALAAFDGDTGRIKWSWKGDGPGYASPMVVDLGGTHQAVTQTQAHVAGVSLAGGQLLWSLPYTTDYVQNIVTPLLYKQTLIISGLNNGTTGLKVYRQGSQWVTEKAWHTPDISMYMSSPVLGGDYVYGMSHRNRGQFFCMDARTGEVRWKTTGREGDNAAVIGAGDFLFLLSSEGELIVARKSPERFEPVRRYTVADSPTWAHPVILGNRILIKDASSLALWSM